MPPTIIDFDKPCSLEEFKRMLFCGHFGEDETLEDHHNAKLDVMQLLATNQQLRELVKKAYECGFETGIEYPDTADFEDCIWDESHTKKLLESIPRGK